MKKADKMRLLEENNKNLERRIESLEKRLSDAERTVEINNKFISLIGDKLHNFGACLPGNSFQESITEGVKEDIREVFTMIRYLGWVSVDDFLEHISGVSYITEGLKEDLKLMMENKDFTENEKLVVSMNILVNQLKKLVPTITGDDFEYKNTDPESVVEMMLNKQSVVD